MLKVLQIHKDTVKLGKDKYGKQSQYPNDTLGNSHGEIIGVESIINAKLVKPGDRISLAVTGKEVCSNCYVHLALEGKRAQAGSMVVIDNTDGVIYYWHPGLSELEKLSNLP